MLRSISTSLRISALRRYFGDKELLIAFLNALFEKEGKVVRSVKYLNKERIPSRQGEKVFVYDLFCEVDEGEDFILEMQHKREAYFKDRCLFYLSRAIVDQSLRGKRWKEIYKLHPVYGIFITDFHLDRGEIPKGPIVEYVLKEREGERLFSEKLRMFFIDLPSFKKDTEEELKNDIERWIYSIKNMGTMQERPQMAKKKPFDRLYSLAELAVMPPAKRRRYETDLRYYWDAKYSQQSTRIFLKQERDEGREEGMVLGREEGILQGRKEGLMEGMSKGHSTALREVVLEMKRNDFSVAVIAQCTKLPVEEVERILQEGE